MKTKHGRRYRSTTSHTDPIIEVGLRELSEERPRPIRDPHKKVHFTVPLPQRGQPWRYEGRSVSSELMRAQYNQVCDEEADTPENTEDSLVLDTELDDEQQAIMDELSCIRPDTPTNTDNCPSDDEMLSSLRVPNKISLGLPNDDDREVFDDETTQHTLMSYFQTADQGTDEVQYGELKSVPVGCTWKNRRLMALSNVHKHQKARIHGGPKGVYSMVMSSPSLFEDFGNEVSFYGEGGRDSKTLKLIDNQQLEKGNLAFMNSYVTKTHLRLIRGAQLKSQVSPKTGYRYDGLYEVSNYTEVKQNGFRMYRFQLLRAGHQPPPPWPSKPVEFPTPILIVEAGVAGPSPDVVSPEFNGRPILQSHLSKFRSRRQQAVYVRHAFKHYGSSKNPNHVLENRKMTVAKGTICGLFGASCCCKTTLSSCIVGRRRQHWRNTRAWRKSRDQRRWGSGKRVSYMPQEIALFGELFIKETMMYFGWIFGMSTQEICERLHFLLSFLDLPSKNRLVKNLNLN
uniref:YDG domain-containing protein n=1 Tax=Timema tahoe TaxID=61484 RepID=A0A7R9FMN0_9NEOP|nr:unnamed protein product [Timema tahoe]